jgi:hypothetical protein
MALTVQHCTCIGCLRLHALLPLACCRAHCAGTPGQLAVYRIVLRRSVEERLLQLADR